MKSIAAEPIGFSRLVALNYDGSNPKMLGQTDSFYDARIRQFDASVVDWLDGSANKILLQRDYVPEEGKIGTHLVRTGVLHDAVHFVQKPFAPEAIAHKVREILSS